MRLDSLRRPRPTSARPATAPRPLALAARTLGFGALCLLVACTGEPAEPEAADSKDKAELQTGKGADGAAKASAEEMERRKEAVRADMERRQKEEAEKLSEMLPDDGWRAPASTFDPKVCQGAPPPEPHNPREIEAPSLPADAHPALTDPSKATEQAPETYKVQFTTTAGDFTIEAHRAWSPNAADRFYNLVKIGYFDQASFFRNIPGFMVQFGISAYPQANAVWKDARIEDEPVHMGNQRGVVTFAKCGAPDCRSTQVFINHGTNANLDSMGFAGFGRVVQGMDVVDKLYGCYGEGAPRGRGPRQDLVQQLGSAYLDAGWPKLDKIESARIVE